MGRSHAAVFVEISSNLHITCVVDPMAIVVNLTIASLIYEQHSLYWNNQHSTQPEEVDLHSPTMPILWEDTRWMVHEVFSDNAEDLSR